MRFSIIIPVYKVELYLHDAVDSILSQSYFDYEIILVDDGSPDSCPEICDTLASANPKIKVIHKENGGSSDARNIGLANASGDYVIYLDSDDKWIDKDGLKYLSEIIDNEMPDAIIFGVNDYYSESGKSVLSRGNYNEALINVLPVSNVVDFLYESHNFPGAAWMFVTKKDFLTENDIYFRKGVTAEDFDWIIKVLSNAKSLKVLDRIIYQYRYNSNGSITSRPRLSGVWGIHNALSNWLASEHISEFQSITNYLSRIYLQAVLNYAGLDKDEQMQVKWILIGDSVILNKSNIVFYRMLYAGVKFFGIQWLSIIVKYVRSLIKKL